MASRELDGRKSSGFIVFQSNSNSDESSCDSPLRSADGLHRFMNVGNVPLTFSTAPIQRAYTDSKLLEESLKKRSRLNSYSFKPQKTRSSLSRATIESMRLSGFNPFEDGTYDVSKRFVGKLMSQKMQIFNANYLSTIKSYFKKLNTSMNCDNTGCESTQRRLYHHYQTCHPEQLAKLSQPTTTCPVLEGRLRAHTNSCNKCGCEPTTTGPVLDGRLRAHTNSCNKCNCEPTTTGPVLEGRLRAHTNSCNKCNCEPTTTGPVLEGRLRAHTNSCNKCDCKPTTTGPVLEGRLRAHTNSCNKCNCEPAKTCPVLEGRLRAHTNSCHKCECEEPINTRLYKDIEQILFEEKQRLEQQMLEQERKEEEILEQQRLERQELERERTKLERQRWELEQQKQAEIRTPRKPSTSFQDFQIPYLSLMDSVVRTWLLKLRYPPNTEKFREPFNKKLVKDILALEDKNEDPKTNELKLKKTIDDFLQATGIWYPEGINEKTYREVLADNLFRQIKGISDFARYHATFGERSGDNRPKMAEPRTSRTSRKSLQNYQIPFPRFVDTVVRNWHSKLSYPPNTEASREPFIDNLVHGIVALEDSNENPETNELKLKMIVDDFIEDTNILYPEQVNKDTYKEGLRDNLLKQIKGTNAFARYAFTGQRDETSSGESFRSPSVYSESFRRPSVYNESTRRPSENIESSRRPSVYNESTRRPSENIESSRRPSVYNESTRRPSEYIESSRRSSVYTESTRRPSENIESSRRPSFYSESTRRPSENIESSRRPSVYSESTRRQSANREEFQIEQTEPDFYQFEPRKSVLKSYDSPPVPPRNITITRTESPMSRRISYADETFLKNKDEEAAGRTSNTGTNTRSQMIESVIDQLKNPKNVEDHKITGHTRRISVADYLKQRQLRLHSSGRDSLLNDLYNTDMEPKLRKANIKIALVHQFSNLQANKTRHVPVENDLFDKKYYSQFQTNERPIKTSEKNYRYFQGKRFPISKNEQHHFVKVGDFRPEIKRPSSSSRKDRRSEKRLNYKIRSESSKKSLKIEECNKNNACKIKSIEFEEGEQDINERQGPLEVRVSRIRINELRSNSFKQNIDTFSKPLKRNNKQPEQGVHAFADKNRHKSTMISLVADSSKNLYIDSHRGPEVVKIRRSSRYSNFPNHKTQTKRLNMSPLPRDRRLSSKNSVENRKIIERRVSYEFNVPLFSNLDCGASQHSPEDGCASQRNYKNHRTSQCSPENYRTTQYSTEHHRVNQYRSHEDCRTIDYSPEDHFVSYRENTKINFYGSDPKHSFDEHYPISLNENLIEIEPRKENMVPQPTSGDVNYKRVEQLENQEEEIEVRSHFTNQLDRGYMSDHCIYKSTDESDPYGSMDDASKEQTCSSLSDIAPKDNDNPSGVREGITYCRNAHAYSFKSKVFGNTSYFHHKNTKVPTEYSKPLSICTLKSKKPTKKNEYCGFLSAKDIKTEITKCFRDFNIIQENEALNKKKAIDAFVEHLQRELTEPNPELSIRKLKCKILFLLKDLNICADAHGQVKLNIHLFSEDIAIRLISIGKRLESTGSQNWKCSLRRHKLFDNMDYVRIGSKEILRSDLQHDLMLEIKDCLYYTKIGGNRHLREQITEKLIDGIELIRKGCTGTVFNEIKAILESTGLLADFEIYDIVDCTMTSAKEIISYINDNHNSNTCVAGKNLRNNYTVSVFMSESETNPSFSGTGCITLNKVSAEETNYTNKLAAVIKNWFTKAPSNFKYVRDEHFINLTIHELALNITDYMKLRKPTAKTKNIDLERFLMYHICKWMLKFNIINNIQRAEPYALVLAQKITKISALGIANTCCGERQTKKETKTLEKSLLIKEEITTWLGEQSPDMYQDNDENDRKRKIKELADKIKPKLDCCTEKEMTRDVRHWMKKVICSRKRKRIDSLSKNLMKRIINLSRNYEQSNMRAKPENIQRNSFTLYPAEAENSLLKNVYKNSIVQNYSDVMQHLIISFIENIFETDDLLTKRGYLMALKAELQKLNPLMRGQALEQDSAVEHCHQKFNNELIYVQDISDWLTEIPIDPYYNITRNKNRVDFIMSLAEIIEETENHRQTDPTKMDYNERLISIIAEYMSILPVKFMPNIDYTALTMLLVKKIISRRNEILREAPDRVTDISDFVGEYIKINGQDVAGDSLRLEAWGFCLNKHIQKLLNEIQTADKSKILNSIQMLTDELLQIFVLKLDFINQINRCMRNLPMKGNFSFEMPYNLALQMTEYVLERIPLEDLVKYIENWISELPLDCHQDIKIELVIHQLLNTMEIVREQNRVEQIRRLSLESSVMETNGHTGQLQPYQDHCSQIQRTDTVLPNEQIYASTSTRTRSQIKNKTYGTNKKAENNLSSVRSGQNKDVISSTTERVSQNQNSRMCVGCGSSGSRQNDKITIASMGVTKNTDIPTNDRDNKQNLASALVGYTQNSDISISEFCSEYTGTKQKIKFINTGIPSQSIINTYAQTDSMRNSDNNMNNKIRPKRNAERRENKNTKSPHSIARRQNTYISYPDTRMYSADAGYGTDEGTTSRNVKSRDLGGRRQSRAIKNPETGDRRPSRIPESFETGSRRPSQNVQSPDSRGGRQSRDMQSSATGDRRSSRIPESFEAGSRRPSLNVQSPDSRGGRQSREMQSPPTGDRRSSRISKSFEAGSRRPSQNVQSPDSRGGRQSSDMQNFVTGDKRPSRSIDSVELGSRKSSRDVQSIDTGSRRPSRETQNADTRDRRLSINPENNELGSRRPSRNIPSTDTGDRRSIRSIESFESGSRRPSGNVDGVNAGSRRTSKNIPSTNTGERWSISVESGSRKPSTTVEGVETGSRRTSRNVEGLESGSRRPSSNIPNFQNTDTADRRSIISKRSDEFGSRRPSRTSQSTDTGERRSITVESRKPSKTVEGVETGSRRTSRNVEGLESGSRRPSSNIPNFEYIATADRRSIISKRSDEFGSRRPSRTSQSTDPGDRTRSKSVGDESGSRGGRQSTASTNRGVRQSQDKNTATGARTSIMSQRGFDAILELTPVPDTGEERRVSTILQKGADDNYVRRPSVRVTSKIEQRIISDPILYEESVEQIVPRYSSRKPGDIMVGLLEEWSERIPLPTSVPPEEQKSIRDSVVTKVLIKTSELNDRMKVTDDDTVYKSLLDKELDNILNMIPHSEELTQKKDLSKQQLISIVESIRPLMKEEQAGFEYTKKLKDDVANVMSYLPQPVNENKNVIEEINEDIVRNFIKYVHEPDELGEIYKNNTREALDRYYTEILQIKLSDRELDNELDKLIDSLNRVQRPSPNALQNVLGQMDMNQEVKSFLSTIPIKEGKDSLEKTLAKELYDMESMGYDDENMEKMRSTIKRYSLSYNVPVVDETKTMVFLYKLRDTADTRAPLEEQDKKIDELLKKLDEQWQPSNEQDEKDEEPKVANMNNNQINTDWNNAGNSQNTYDQFYRDLNILDNSQNTPCHQFPCDWNKGGNKQYTDSYPPCLDCNKAGKTKYTSCYPPCMDSSKAGNTQYTVGHPCCMDSRKVDNTQYTGGYSSYMDSSYPSCMDSSYPSYMDSSYPSYMDSSYPYCMDSSYPYCMDSSYPSYMDSNYPFNKAAKTKSFVRTQKTEAAKCCPCDPSNSVYKENVTLKNKSVVPSNWTTNTDKKRKELEKGTIESCHCNNDDIEDNEQAAKANAFVSRGSTKSDKKRKKLCVCDNSMDSKLFGSGFEFKPCKALNRKESKKDEFLIRLDKSLQFSKRTSLSTSASDCRCKDTGFPIPCKSDNNMLSEYMDKYRPPELVRENFPIQQTPRKCTCDGSRKLSTAILPSIPPYANAQSCQSISLQPNTNQDVGMAGRNMRRSVNVNPQNAQAVAGPSGYRISQGEQNDFGTDLPSIYKLRPGKKLFISNLAPGAKLYLPNVPPCENICITNPAPCEDSDNETFTITVSRHLNFPAQQSLSTVPSSGCIEMLPSCSSSVNETQIRNRMYTGNAILSGAASPQRPNCVKRHRSDVACGGCNAVAGIGPRSKRRKSAAISLDYRSSEHGSSQNYSYFNPPEQEYNYHGYYDLQ